MVLESSSLQSSSSPTAALAAASIAVNANVFGLLFMGFRLLSLSGLMNLPAPGTKPKLLTNSVKNNAKYNCLQLLIKLLLLRPKQSSSAKYKSRYFITIFQKDFDLFK